MDSNWVIGINSGRFTNGYVFALFGSAISWMSKWQGVIALSTTKAKCMVATLTFKEAIWLKCLCSNIGFDARKITIYCDSKCHLFSKESNLPCQKNHIDINFIFSRYGRWKGKVGKF